MSDDPLELLGKVALEERVHLAAIARREGLSPEDAVDCVQDAFCTFLRLALGQDLPASLPAYLAEIVRNTARNKRRRHYVARTHVDVDETPIIEPIAVEKALEEAEEHVRLRGCVDRLCDTQRAVVTLRMLDERGGEDVASALGISRGHVDVLLHRAKVHLRACMTE